MFGSNIRYLGVDEYERAHKQAKETNYTTSSAFVFGIWKSALVAATCTMVSTMRHASLKLAADALRKISLDISRARVSRDEMYSPT